MREQQLIERVRAMTDPADVDKQLGKVHRACLEITSYVRSGLADARQWLKSSPLFTRQDLDDELK